MTLLNELREVVRELLLSEAGVADFANAQAGRYGLVRFEVSDTKVCLVVVSKSEEAKAGHLRIPKPLGLVTATKVNDGGWRIAKMYADSAPVAILLLAASLEAYKRVYTDYSVSPAAQQVIKRYFDKNEDDPTKVHQNADKWRMKDDREPDFLRAAYLGPVGFDLRGALKQGEAAVDPYIADQDQEAVEEAILGVAGMGFHTAYGNDDRTKARKKPSDVPSEA